VLILRRCLPAPTQTDARPGSVTPDDSGWAPGVPAFGRVRGVRATYTDIVRTKRNITAMNREWQTPEQNTSSSSYDSIYSDNVNLMAFLYVDVAAVDVAGKRY